MKNKVLFLLPLMLLGVSSCSLSFGIELNEQSTSGLVGSMAASETFEYFDGDSLGDLSIYTKKEINMSKVNSTVDFSNGEDVVKYFNGDVDAVTSVEDVKYLAKNPEGLRVGNNNADKSGSFTINTVSEIKKMVVVAKPYKSVVQTLEGEIISFDEPVGIRVNDSKYVKCVNTAEEVNEYSLTNCNFDLGEGTNKITIYAGPLRAVISQIVLYY